VIRSLCVYCGSNFGADPAFAAATRELAQRLAEREIRLVYGGSTVVRIIPQTLMDKEIAHRGLSDLRVVDTMHERKALMVELSDGFVALPGGIGTLEELIEVYTWSQLGMHAKPVGALNVNGYYDGLAGLLDHMVGQRFLRPERRAVLAVEAEVGALLERLENAVAPSLGKWL
jgi:hypothetical protein